MAEMSHPELVEGLSQANETKDPRPVYEAAFHIVPAAGEAEVSTVVESIRALLTKAGAESIKDQYPQKMALAYTIERAIAGKREKFSESYFGFIKFAAEREHIAALEVLLRGSKEVLRYLLVETTREEPVIARRAVYSSNRLEGETIKKPSATPETPTEVSEEALQKSIDALVN